MMSLTGGWFTVWNPLGPRSKIQEEKAEPVNGTRNRIPNLGQRIRT